MTGKNKCKILKEIRKQIAADNDIEFVTSECKHQGECRGTCPKCEAEVRYLENELAKRQQLGKAVAVAGIAATFMVTATGCLPFQTTAGDPMPSPSSSVTETLAGMLLPLETLVGELVYPTETEQIEIDGDIAYDTEPTEPPVPGGIPYETEPTGEELMGEPMPDPTEAPEDMGEVPEPQE